MATTKTFNNVRLQLKYDTLANWTTNNPVLLKGEIAFTSVPTASGDVKQAPAMLMKVGDGETAYNDLKFVSGLAANVHAWALAENKPEYNANEINGLADFISAEIEDTNTKYQIVKVDDYTFKLQSKEADGAWTDVAENGTVTIPKYDDTAVKADITALQTKVGDKTVKEQIDAAITALNLDTTYEAKGAAATALTTAKAYTDDLAKGAVATNTAAIAAIKDGKDIDSFADVETKISETATAATAAANKALEDAKTYADGKDTAIKAAKDAADAAQKDVDALEATIGTVTENKTVVEMIEDAKTAATYDDTAVKADIKTNADAIKTISDDYLKAADKTELEGKITANETKITTLVGEDTGKSVRTIANEELATQLIPENAKDSLDTLQEIAAWIQNHPDDVTAMNASISALEEKVGDTAVATQITEAINALKEGDIKTATDRIAALEKTTHSHTNKDLLDTYTQTEANLADAVAKKHSHTNATVLNGISAEKVANWDAAKTGVDSLTEKVGTVTEGKTVVEMIEDAKTAATYDDTAVKADIKTNADDIDALEGRATALETNAVLTGDTLILNCGDSTIA